MHASSSEQSSYHLEVNMVLLHRYYLKYHCQQSPTHVHENPFDIKMNRLNYIGQLYYKRQLYSKVANNTKLIGQVKCFYLLIYTV